MISALFSSCWKTSGSNQRNSCWFWRSPFIISTAAKATVVYILWMLTFLFGVGAVWGCSSGGWVEA